MHAPNTLGGSCLDGARAPTAGWIQRLRVYTADGSPLRAGATATVAIDAFTTPPSPLPLSLNNHLTTTFTLPAGATQVIRAAFGTSPNVCSTDPYTERDDLVFAVAP